ncbi:MAG: hypothetical protein ACUVSX_09325 [Aggregatilineales bacterium]
MAAEGSRSVAQLERDLGIATGLVYKWQQRYRVRADSLRCAASPRAGPADGRCQSHAAQRQMALRHRLHPD